MSILECQLRVPRRYLRDLAVEAKRGVPGILVGRLPLGAAQLQPITAADRRAPGVEVLGDGFQSSALRPATRVSR